MCMYVWAQTKTKGNIPKSQQASHGGGILSDFYTFSGFSFLLYFILYL